MAKTVLYRAMIEAEDGRPRVVSTARGLGLRVSEIPLGEGGFVVPRSPVPC
jgi:hypothetical protein